MMVISFDCGDVFRPWWGGLERACDSVETDSGVGEPGSG
jgi:hypothetical protein